MGPERRVLHPEWRDANETTAYPFEDGVSLTNADGDFVPETLLLDAVLHPVGAAGGLYLSAVEVTSESASLVVADSRRVEVARGVLSLSQLPAAVALEDPHGRPAGLLVSESSRLAVLQSWSEGAHRFEAAATRFAARVCVPVPGVGLRGFVLDDGSVVSGDVWLLGDDGVVLRAGSDFETGAEPGDPPRAVGTIRVDVVGDPLFRRRLCGGLFQTPRILKSVTFQQGSFSVRCGPDASGNVGFAAGNQDAADSVLRIRTGQGELRVEVVGPNLLKGSR